MGEEEGGLKGGEGTGDHHKQGNSYSSNTDLGFLIPTAHSLAQHVNSCLLLCRGIFLHFLSPWPCQQRRENSEMGRVKLHCKQPGSNQTAWMLQCSGPGLVH